MKAKFKVGDKVLVHTNSSTEQQGVITDTLQDTDDTWFYQVKVLFEDWVIAENELSLYVTPKYSLACNYYDKEHDSLDTLMEDIVTSGMDPNYEITCGGKRTGEMAANLIQY